MRLTCFMAVFVTLSSAAMEQTAPPAPVQPPIVVTGDKDAAQQKIICKLTSTGTMLQKRICMTKAEWASVQTNSEEALKQMRDWQRVRCNYGTRC